MLHVRFTYRAKSRRFFLSSSYLTVCAIPIFQIYLFYKWTTICNGSKIFLFMNQFCNFSFMNLPHDKCFFHRPCQISSIPIKLPKERLKDIARLTHKHMKVRNISAFRDLSEYLDTEEFVVHISAKFHKVIKIV